MLHPDVVYAALVHAIVQERYDWSREKLHPDIRVEQLEMDSLDVVEIAMGMEDYHGLEHDLPQDIIDVALLHNPHWTLKEACVYIAEKVL